MSGTGLYFEQVEIGDEIGPIYRVVTEEQVNEFVRMIRGGRSGPRYFTDRNAAGEDGLPGLIVPGAMSTALLSQLLTGWSHTIILNKLDVIFRQVVLHNTPIQVRGIVIDKSVVDGEPQIGCDVIVENKERVQLVIGNATVVLPSRMPSVP